MVEAAVQDFLSDILPRSPLYRKRIERAAKKAGYKDPEEFLYVAVRFYLQHLKTTNECASCCRKRKRRAPFEA